MTALIDLPDGAPGIMGPLLAYPDTAAPLGALADALLRADGGLSRADRERIAAAVSRGNDCTFCEQSHAAVARAHERAAGSIATAGPLLIALLDIAEQVRLGGRQVTDEAVAAARAAGATDRDLHDTVLIAAAFCMFNRYVDGLRTALPTDPQEYERTAAMLAASGYARAL